MSFQIIIVINFIQIYLSFILIDSYLFMKTFFLTKDYYFRYYHSILICLNVMLLKLNRFMENLTSHSRI